MSLSMETLRASFASSGIVGEGKGPFPDVPNVDFGFFVRNWIAARSDRMSQWLFTSDLSAFPFLFIFGGVFFFLLHMEMGECLLYIFFAQGGLLFFFLEITRRAFCVTSYGPKMELACALDIETGPTCW